MNNYVYKNPYTQRKNQKKTTIVNVEEPKPIVPYVYRNPYVQKKEIIPSILTSDIQNNTNQLLEPTDDVAKEITYGDCLEQNKMVSTVLPAALVGNIDMLGLSRIMKDKVFKLVSILYLKGMYNNHDLSVYVPLAAHYFEKVFNKEYHTDFFNKLKATNIIQCNEEYQQGSTFKKGKCKSYRLNNELLNDAYVLVFYEDRKQKKAEKDGGLRKAEIFINRTYLYKDINNHSNDPVNESLSSTSTNQVLPNTSFSMHISSRLFQKSLIIDDLSSLKYNQDKIWIATKKRIANISSRLFVDDKILRNSFEVTNCLLNNFTYHTTKEKAMKWAKEYDANVIQDGRHFYIQQLKKYIKGKKLNVYRNYKWQVARIKEGMFYAKRNDTNWRGRS